MTNAGENESITTPRHILKDDFYNSYVVIVQIINFLVESHLESYLQIRSFLELFSRLPFQH